MKPVVKIKKIMVFLGCLIVAAGILSLQVNYGRATESSLNLPSSIIVRIEVVNGTESYFVTTLSGVPSGYDVTNSAYLGWCIDTETPMARSPAIHDVLLYSSLDPPNGTLADQRWDMVNYILNHKQGNVTDIQNAIWYFVNFNNGTEVPPESDIAAWRLINDALANGTGFIPAPGQIAAVICDPVLLLPQPEFVQISIIEVTVADPVVPEFSLTTMLAFILAATLSTIVISKKKKLRHRRQHSFSPSQSTRLGRCGEFLDLLLI